MHQASSITRIFVDKEDKKMKDQNKKDGNVNEEFTKETIREKIEANDKQFLSRFSYYTKNIRHTAAFWNTIKGYLNSLLIHKQKMPHWY